MGVRMLILMAVLGIVATPAAAQTAAPASRIWVDVNFAASMSAASETTFAFEDVIFGEPFQLAATYPKPSSAMGVDIGGGVWLTPKFGVGIAVMNSTREDAAELFAELPHPFDLNLFASDRADSDPLERQEREVHLSVSYLLRSEGPLSVRLFGGPTFFSYTADMVFDIVAEQIAGIDPPTNEVTIVGEELVRAEASGVGFNVGADISYFFTRTFGVGGVIRFSRGSVTLDEEPMSEVAQDITVGGFSLGGGVRIRF